MSTDLQPFEIDVYFGKETVGSYEVSWYRPWSLYVDITYEALVAKCNESLMEEHPDTDLSEYTLIINMASGVVVTETNIGAVMLEAKCSGDKIMPLYSKLHPSSDYVPKIEDVLVNSTETHM
ncbi:hypothetical protein DSL72_001130 [Monilinia vaccinii-corymbosi]|uniref:Uncharacterized protein n=1 Tax=Monilinia vaccinii-corymbosi TaxID=61207 RepID=A0A8A3P169_9HELO|nr:hypothetical protein DSL72_001130 [Monilinia vaccinii-corymbosi]